MMKKRFNVPFQQPGADTYAYVLTIPILLLVVHTPFSCTFEGTRADLVEHLEQCKFEGLKVIVCRINCQHIKIVV